MFGDYRKVGDVMLAHSVTTTQDGQEFMKMAITKVTFNSSLEDAFFKMASRGAWAAAGVRPRLPGERCRPAAAPGVLLPR